MKKTVTFLGRGNALVILLTGALFLFSLSQASAQQNAQGTLNPYTHIASKLDVTAYSLGTFERTHTIEVLEQILNSLKPLLSNGGGTLSQRLKYDFCNQVVSDISTQYIAVEISLLTSLSGLVAQNSSTEIQQSQLRNLYAEVVAQLQ